MIGDGERNVYSRAMTHVLLCLHGWGGSKESFTELREALKNDAIRVLIPDLPGFGEEPEPPRPWTTDDYAQWTEQWFSAQLSHLKTHDSRLTTAVLGHSHGGRIAIKMALRGNVHIDHLYLCAAAGIRHGRHFKRIVGLTLAKSGKAFLSIPGLKALQPVAQKLLYKLVRVHDYERASAVMRQTLINVTQEDLRPQIHRITIPTDIVWGKQDRMTPFADALVMHQSIKGSKLHAYDGVRHRVHRDRAPEIAQIVRDTIGSH